MVVFGCFVFSGASALVLELVWTRQLTLLFGSTTLAISTVLAVFMGGLALGSSLAGRRADHLRRPLYGYALVEAGIGVYALAVPLLLRGIAELSGVYDRAIAERPLPLALLRFAFAAALLLPPTTLMGTTLPLLARRFAGPGRGDSGTGSGGVVGRLYALNTLGAVGGALLAGFVLLPGCGLARTNYAAAATDLLLAAAAFLCARWSPPAAAVGPELPVSEVGEPSTEGRRSFAPGLALAGFAVSGGAAMLDQVLWTRALQVVLGSSVYSFTLILVVFLAGLAGGAALLSGVAARSRRPLAWLAAVHLGVAAAVAASARLMDRLPAAFLALLRAGVGGADTTLAYHFMITALAILPATVLMGGVLPLTLAVYSSAPGRIGKEVGTAYALNTVGAIVGSFASGFLVVPLIGIERGLKLAALTSAVIGCGLLAAGYGRPRRRLTAAVAALGLAIAVVATQPRWNLEHFSAGLFRVSIAKDILESHRWVVPELLYYHDGIATSVSVERWSGTLALKNNGKVDASSADDMATQILVGLMPLLLHPTALERAPRVAVIGFGSGVTVGAVTQFPVGPVDVIELEPAVVEAGTRFFAAYNHRPELDPRVRVRIGDGRNFLAQPGGAYDAIISEPSNPWVSGASSLFTVEYWELASRRLAPDGVFCQWAQLYELSAPNVKSILASFARVFPYTYVFSAEDLSSDLLLVASRRPLVLDLERLARGFLRPALAAELRRAGVERPEDVLASVLLAPHEIDAFTVGVPLNTDDNARIEFAAPRDLLASFGENTYLARVYGEEWPYGHFEPFVAGIGQGRARAAAELEIAGALIRHGKRAAAARLVAAARRHGAPAESRAAAVVDLLGDGAPGQAASEAASPPADLDPGRLAAPSTIEPRAYALLCAHVRARRWAQALALLRGWPPGWLDQSGPELGLLTGYILYRAGLFGEAVERLKPLALESFVARHPVLLYFLARAEYSSGLHAAGAREMERFLAVSRRRSASAAQLSRIED